MNDDRYWRTGDRLTGVDGSPDDYVDALADAYAQVAEAGLLRDYIGWIRQA
jgi:hypothetical protein